MKKKWSTIKIPEVLFFQEGPGVRKHQFTTEGVKLLNVGNINDGRIDLSKTKIYISEKEASSKYKHFLIDDGDLVIASSGIVVDNFHNKIAFIEKKHLPLCMNTSTIRFKAIDKTKIDINYFKYFLKTRFFSSQLQRLITGSAQLNFGPSHLQKIDLLLPPLDDQKRIVDMLDKADALRQKRKQAIDLLDEYPKSVFLKMFGDPVNNPKGWQTCRGAEYSELLTVGVVIKPASYYVEKGVAALRSLNIKPNKIDLSNLVFFSEEVSNSVLSKSILRQGDVVIVRTGSTGTAAVINKELDGANCIDMIIVRPRKEIIDPFYLSFLFNSERGKQLVASKEVGGIQKHFNIGAINKLDIPVPPINIQNKFAEIVERTENLKEKMITQSEELENQFQALMQKAFKGQL